MRSQTFLRAAAVELLLILAASGAVAARVAGSDGAVLCAVVAAGVAGDERVGVLNPSDARDVVGDERRVTQLHWDDLRGQLAGKGAPVPGGSVAALVKVVR